MWFFYDADGNPSGFKYQNGSTVYNYYYVCNWRGDVVALYANDGLKYTYEYDAWGKMLAIRNVSGEDVTGAANIANYNPLRYRGYYYDSETGLYYINSRYYDPQVKRFVNSDDDLLSATSKYTLTNKNYFAYCDNNPIIRVDEEGNAWQIIYIAGCAVLNSIDSAIDVVDTYKNGGNKTQAWLHLGVSITFGAVSGALDVATGFSTGKGVSNAVDILEISANAAIDLYYGENIEEVVFDGVVSFAISQTFSSIGDDIGKCATSSKKKYGEKLVKSGTKRYKQLSSRALTGNVQKGMSHAMAKISTGKKLKKSQSY